MLNRTIILSSVALTLLAISVAAPAAVSADKAAQLGGKQLTPTAAKRAGSEDGVIPPWTGGLTTPPADFKGPTHRYPNPFPDDKPEFVITAANMDQYREHLTDGQIALLKKWPDSYKMPVYKTRRSYADPQWVYDAVKKNAIDGELVADGEGIDGVTGGIPFPFIEATSNPAKAAIWNHKLRYLGQSVRHVSAQIVTDPGSSDYQLSKLQIQTKFMYSRPNISFDDLHNIAYYYLQKVIAPPRSAGQFLLLHETMNQVKRARGIWVYNPGQRRVRRAPNVAYDNPGTDSDGMRTVDQQDMFNGATDRYDWKYLGKKKIYIPYNSYDLEMAPDYDTIVGPKHVNQDLTRYELHRVYVVEARVKKTTSHIYARRKFYIDEDDWNISAEDLWDDRGHLWRVMERHTIELYDKPFMAPAMLSSYDLDANRYLLLDLNNDKERYWDDSVHYDDSFFNPRNISRRAIK